MDAKQNPHAAHRQYARNKVSATHNGVLEIQTALQHSAALCCILGWL
ncbi:hypothetical protein [Neisseria sp.]